MRFTTKKVFKKSWSIHNVHQDRVETPYNKPHVERNYGTINTSLLDDFLGKASTPRITVLALANFKWTAREN
ncbi:hypothetical protein DA096_13380 [Vibrio rotiferianus]|nr:hypothetical protein DA095_16795 [Vibrio rotiferianus]TMX57760.1 hypothetical protein DA093_05480 [Vibrio rotiferianus]TMX62775.1 hypothetical protein DA096_13380 [Vibrio rotiferianus]